MKFENMERIVSNYYDIDGINSALYSGGKSVLYNDIIEGLYRKIEYDFYNSKPTTNVSLDLIITKDKTIK